MPPTAAELQEHAMGVHLDEQGGSFVFGAVTFKALTPEPLVASRGVPRGLAFGIEHDVEIQALRSAFIGTPPKAGDTITQSGRKYRVIGVQEAPGSHVITFLCTKPT